MLHYPDALENPETTTRTSAGRSRRSGRGPSPNKRKCKKVIKQMVYKDTGGFLPLNKTQLAKTLILDMDETLVHTDFAPSFKYERTLEVRLDGDLTILYLSVRPGVAEFIDRMARIYELVLFTASVSSYANPIINLIDPERKISHRLFRQH